MQIIITKTVEEVIDNPHERMTNLQKTLIDIEKQRENLNNLEKEVKANIELIWSHIGAFVVNVTEWWKKVIAHEIGKWIDIDVTRGDQIAFNNIDAWHICDAKMNERRMKKETKQESLEETDKKE